MKIYTKEIIKEKNKRKEKVKKFLKSIFIPIFVIICLALIYIGYQKIVQKKNNIELFGYKMYVVLTGSMKPGINPSDIVVVKKVKDSNDIKNGDIITFSVSSNSTVTHRVVDIVEDEGKILYKTKGDNNSSEDLDLVSFENIQGIFQFKISKIGAIITGGLTGTGTIIIFLFLILSYHHSVKKEDRILTREEARKKYNIYKYKDKEDTNESN